MRAAPRFDDQDVTFLGIVYQDRPESAIGMLDAMGRGYDNMVDPGSRAAIDFGVFGVPETFFIDRDGTVVAKAVGRSDLPLTTALRFGHVARRPTWCWVNGEHEVGLLGEE